MGSGKSSIGRLLAKKIDKYFIDTDSLIEHSENKTIDVIFKTKGEPYFRELEKNTFNWLINIDNAVISTGGGLPVHIDNLKKVGRVIYLKIDFEVILSRLNQDEIIKRPLFQNIDKARELYYQRDKIYSQKADIVVSTDIKIDDIVSKIIDLI